MDYKFIFGIFIPILVDQAFLVLMSLFNTAMISSSGVAAVSAVSMVDSLNIFLVNVFIAVATGGTVIVAQYKGKGQLDMVSRTATQAIGAATIVSVAIGGSVIIFNQPVLNLLFGNAEPEVFRNATIYLIGSCISYPFMAIFQAVSGSLRGVGETKPVLGLSLLMNLTNLGLNVLFITILDLGVTGLVISVITARLLGMIGALIYLIQYNQTIRVRIREVFQLDLTILKKVMFIGLPFAAEQLFFNGGKLLTQTFIVKIGTLALTANAIGSSIAVLVQTAPNALSITIVTIVGQCIGRRNIADARKFVKSFIGFSAILSVVTSVVFLPFFPLLMKMFAPPAEIVPTILTLVLISVIAQPIFWSLSFIMPSALRAAGDSRYTSVMSLLSMWLLRVVLGYILGITLGYGIIGVWIAMVAEWAVRGLIFTRRFMGDKWYAHKLV